MGPDDRTADQIILSILTAAAALRSHDVDLADLRQADSILWDALGDLADPDFLAGLAG